MSEPELTVVAVEAYGDRRGLGETTRRLVEERVAVDVLKTNLGGFVDAIRDLLAGQATDAGPFALHEIGLTVEIGADGELKLLGAGVGLHGSSGLQLTWRRSGDT